MKLGIKAVNLEKVYADGTHALKGLSFEISKPGLYGLIGPNGAGKTTLFKLISSLLVPTKGKVFVNGGEVQYSSKLIKQMIGFLPENAGLYDKLSAKDFLHIMAGLHGLEGQKRRERVKQIVEYVGITFAPGKIIRTLSTGQKRLLMLASVLLHDPQIVILDETLSGLDPIHRHEISLIMQDLAKNKIVFFSSHILADIWRLCERILVLNEGKLVRDDTPENLLAKMSANKYFVSITKNREKVIELLKQQEAINQIKVEGDKIIFHAPSLREANQAIDILLKHSEMLSFGPNIADLDELFRRLVINNG